MSNGEFFKDAKYFAFYSDAQFCSMQTYDWRLFNIQYKGWVKKHKIFLRRYQQTGYKRGLDMFLAENPKPVFKIRCFMDRRGKPVEVTDVYNIQNCKNLDELLMGLRERWADIEFRGVVIEQKGRRRKIL